MDEVVEAPRDGQRIPQPRAVASPALPGVDSLLTLNVSVVIIAALYFGRDILIPVTLAVILSFLLGPLAGALRRLGCGRTIGVLFSVLIALSVLLGVGSVIGLQIAQFSDDFPRYQSALEDKADTVRLAVVRNLSSIENQLGPERPAATPRAPSGHGQAPPAKPPQGTPSNPLSVQVQPPAPGPAALAREFLWPVLSPIGTLALVLVISVFILLQKEDLRDRLIRLFGSSDLHRTTLAMNDAARRLSKYFLTQLAINSGFGVVITVGLGLLGVPSPALWGLIAMLMRFVPYVGIYIAAAPAVLMAASIAPGWAPAIWTLGIFLAGEALVGQVVEPLAYGHSTGLSPVSIVIATIFWAWIWGAVGLVLATPITLCLVVLGRHVKRLEFLDVLLGDRPALTPVESLYQRILANDADEAASQAELLLRERPLSTYYDDVALTALKLAGYDVRRGVISREQLLTMRAAVHDLIEDLDEFDDALPTARRRDDGAAAPPQAELAVPYATAVPRDAPPREEWPVDWQAEAPVLCLGGRSPLDDASAAMTAQLLSKHGMPATPIFHENLSRAAIARLPVEGVGAICVCYLATTGSPAHLRFLLRRLRQRAPHTRLILGLWDSDDDDAGWPDAATLADGLARTLRDAVTQCVDAAYLAVEAARTGVAG